MRGACTGIEWCILLLLQAANYFNVNQNKQTKKSKVKVMTVDELAGIIATSFADVNQRFNQMDVRFDGIDKRFDAHDQRFTGVEKKLDEIEFFMTGQGRRIEILEDRVRQLATKLGLDFRR